MNKIYVYSIGFNDKNLLLLGIIDINKLKQEEILNLKCVCAELNNKIIHKPSSFVSQIKFGEWSDSFSEEEEKELIQKIHHIFSEQEIEEKIIKPLSQIESII